MTIRAYKTDPTPEYGVGQMKDGEGPHEMSDTDLAFAPKHVYEHMPAYKPEFFRRDNPWGKVFLKWFYEGLPKGVQFYPKPGIDSKKAYRHIAAIMRSFESKHEHKTAACAYLMSIWFEKIEFPEKAKDDPS